LHRKKLRTWQKMQKKRDILSSQLHRAVTSRFVVYGIESRKRRGPFVSIEGRKGISHQGEISFPAEFPIWLECVTCRRGGGALPPWGNQKAWTSYYKLACQVMSSGICESVLRHRSQCKEKEQGIGAKCILVANIPLQTWSDCKQILRGGWVGPGRDGLEGGILFACITTGCQFDLAAKLFLLFLYISLCNWSTRTFVVHTESAWMFFFFVIKRDFFEPEIL